MEFQAHRPLPSALRALRAPAGAAARVGAPGPGGSCSQPPPQHQHAANVWILTMEKNPNVTPPRAAASAAQGQPLPCFCSLLFSGPRRSLHRSCRQRARGLHAPKRLRAPRASPLGALSGRHKEAVHRTPLVMVLKMHRIPPGWWWLRAWQHLCPPHTLSSPCPPLFWCGGGLLAKLVKRLTL